MVRRIHAWFKYCFHLKKQLGALLACRGDEERARMNWRREYHVGINKTKRARDSIEFRENKCHHLQNTGMLDVKMRSARLGSSQRSLHMWKYDLQSAARITVLTVEAVTHSRLPFSGKSFYMMTAGDWNVVLLHNIITRAHLPLCPGVWITSAICLQAYYIQLGNLL